MIRVRHPRWVPVLGLGGLGGAGAALPRAWGDPEPGLPLVVLVVGAASALVSAHGLWFRVEADRDGLRVRSLLGRRVWSWDTLQAVLLAPQGRSEAPVDDVSAAAALVVWGPGGRVRIPRLVLGFGALVDEVRARGRLGRGLPPPRWGQATFERGFAAAGGVLDGIHRATQPITLGVGVGLAGLVGFVAADLVGLSITGALTVDAGLWAGGVLTAWVSALAAMAAWTRRTQAMRDPWELGARTCLAMLGALLVVGGGDVASEGEWVGGLAMLAAGGSTAAAASWPRRSRA